MDDSRKSALSGLRVLLVEDDALIALALRDTLIDMGCVIAGMAAFQEKALECARTLDLDAAVLDVNLHGKTVYPAAEALAKRGIPFVFVTAYGRNGLQPDWQDRPVIQKPYNHLELERLLCQCAMC